MGIAAIELGQADETQDLAHPLAADSLAQSVQTEPHVVADREVGKERVVLEDDPDATLLRRHSGSGAVGHRAPRDRDVPRVRGLESGDEAQGGGFAAPGWTKQGEDPALLDAEREFIDGGTSRGSVPLGHAGEGEDRHAQAVIGVSGGLPSRTARFATTRSPSLESTSSSMVSTIWQIRPWRPLRREIELLFWQGSFEAVVVDVDVGRDQIPSRLW